MSFRAFCNECNAPIDPRDNHIALDGITIINHGKVLQTQQAHFDCHECLTSFFVKAMNRPVLVATPGQN